MRTVQDNFQRAFGLAHRWDPDTFRIRTIWINDGSGGPGKQHMRSIEIESGWIEDLAKPITSGSGEILLSDCDAGLQVRSSHLPRRPEVSELLYVQEDDQARTQWQIVSVKEHQGLYTIGLNRARAGKQ